MKKLLKLTIPILFFVSILIPYSTTNAVKCANVTTRLPDTIAPQVNGQMGTQSQEIHHLFTHALIAHPDIAFSSTNPMRSSYDIDCLTPKEFKKILQSLYERNFILVNIHDIYSVDSHGAHKKTVCVPTGKKPLILSFDDINYYIKKMHLGMVDKLIVSNERLATFTQNSLPQISYDNDVVPLLENFIASHPDFSHKGARGMLNLTGFDGILGYRTHQNSPTRQSEIKKAKIVIEKLKQNGWTFSCHSYGHYHMQKISDTKFSTDTDKWLSEVVPLVGKTDIYVYPYGEFTLKTGKAIAKKHQKLLESGFRIFMGVGNLNYFATAPSLPNISALFMDRIPMDGNTMRHGAQKLAPYFSVPAVYDSSRPSKL